MRHRAWFVALPMALSAAACGRDTPPTTPPAPARAPASAALASAAAPPAPSLLAPNDGASVTVPFTIAWSSVIDPTATNGGYNWQVSTSPTFSPLILADATSPGATQDVVSGLPNGTYYWRVNAASPLFGEGVSDWSATRSFTVTGPAPGSLPAPTLLPTQGYSTFHPEEVIRFHWRRVTGAVTYRLEVSNARTFPLGSPTEGILTFANDNIADTTDGFRWGTSLGQGRFFARVFAVDADNPQEGVRGLPSNVIEFTVSYTNPVGPPPVPLSPPNGATVSLPLTLTWAHVPNPQPSGYEVQVSASSSFTQNETPLGVQLTEPEFRILTLTPGTKFWRVRSAQGMASPTTVANTAWSAVRSFTLTSTVTPVSITPLRAPLYSGDDTGVRVQLSAGTPAGGATVALSSSHPGIAPVPPTLAVPATDALAEFQMVAGQVAVPTVVTLTATLNGVSRTGQFTVYPSSLKSLTTSSPNASAGAPAGAILMLNGEAPAGGATVSLTSSSPAARPPATVTIPAGGRSTFVSIPTSDVAASTPVTITASWNGATVQMPITLQPSPAPTSLTLFPATFVGGDPGSVDGRVTIGAASSFDQTLRVSSTHPAVLPTLSPSVTIMAGSTVGLIQILPAAVTTTTVVTISVTGGGVTRTANLTVTPRGTPTPAPLLTSFTVSPTSVPGGTPATGTVRLAAAAPSGGTVVLLGSNLPGSASVPPSVTVPAGATSAGFTITTFPAGTTTVQLNARLDDTILFASLGVGPPPAPTTPSAPSLLSPANGATPAQPVRFDWGDVAGAAAYAIEIDDSGLFTAPLVASQSPTVSEVTLAGLPARQLWWRVRARNSAGTFGPYSAVRQLTPQGTSGTTLGAPGLVAPSNDQRFSAGQTITFDWGDVAGAASYTIEIDDDDDFPAPAVRTQTVTASQYATSTLPTRTMWWRVRANSSSGTPGPWSSVRRFEVR